MTLLPRSVFSAFNSQLSTLNSPLYVKTPSSNSLFHRIFSLNFQFFILHSKFSTIFASSIVQTRTFYIFYWQKQYKPLFTLQSPLCTLNSQYITLVPRSVFQTLHSPFSTLNFQLSTPHSQLSSLNSNLSTNSS
jgi:hypothetical protein